MSAGGGSGLVITKTSPLVAAELSLDEQEELMELTRTTSLNASSHQVEEKQQSAHHFTSLIDEKSDKHQIFKQIQETMDILKHDLLNKSNRSSEYSDAAPVNNANKQDEIERLRLEQEMVQRERDMIEEEKEKLRLEAERLRLEREMILANGLVSNGSNFMNTTYLVMTDSNVNYTNVGLPQKTSLPSTSIQQPQKVILKKPISPPPALNTQQQQQRINSNLNNHQQQHQQQQSPPASMSHVMYSMDQNLRLSVPNLILDQQPHGMGCQQQLPVAAQTASPYKASSGNQNKQYQPHGSNTARIYQTSNSRSHKLIGNFFLLKSE